MLQMDLNGTWRMQGGGFDCCGQIPGSVYSFLLHNGLMEDPYYRQNELKALKLMEHTYTFSRSFDFVPTGDRVLLHCDGLDTLCDIYVNETHVAHTENMHRTYEFDITELLQEGTNQISVVCHPVDAYIKERQEKEFLLGSSAAMEGFGHLRKAHCMFGWDWGPRLPDAGIWRNICLLVLNSARITDFHVLQKHEENRVFVTPVVTTDREAEVIVTVQAPDGTSFTMEANKETEIQNASLWWPNGLGAQPLYTFRADLIGENAAEVQDSRSLRIGFRSMKLIREKDVYGESFCHEVNGIRFFAMGADYIPEDNILSRVTRERTAHLLKQCVDSNFNAIRVWGGGYYPDDFFFDICDELGLIVFQDAMVACAMIRGDEASKADFKEELRDNFRRMRHHACLAIISGNNEVEETFTYTDNQKSLLLKDDYIEIFEGLVPDVIKEVCPYIPYVPSSPSSCGHFIDPTNENYGDCHYWQVWHGNKPFTEYRNKYFRYLSEFGFQSFPCEKTVNAFTEEQDRNIFSRVMEMHQRNTAANGKIMNYLSATFLYPTEFGTLLYASQLLQAEAIRYGVEHFRRNRGRCMGTLYWQLNDIWPVASWASIDYYGRYKALQYVAKRFYSPVLISCKETGETTGRPHVVMEPEFYDFETKAQLCVTNDTLVPVAGLVKWALRDSSGSILQESSQEITVPALSAMWLEEMDFAKTDVENHYMSYAFEVYETATKSSAAASGATIISEGTVLFTAPKHFLFRDPKLRYEMQGDEITVYADAYAKYVEIDSPDSDFILSDNYFDMNAGKKTVKILEGIPKTIALMSVYDIR